MQTSLSDILHVISQALLIPDIILLIGLIAYALFSIGSILVEFFTEHRHYKVAMPKFLSALTSSSESLIPSVIGESGLLNRQKEALNTVFEYRTLPGDALLALVRRLMSQEEAHYDKITARNNMAARVAPMLGLVGTLIPLGPGIQALGNADTAQLSASLLVAFDTTVAGLVVAAICLVIGKIRSTWYDNYLSALDSAMATMVQKIEDDRTPGAAGASGVESQPMQVFGQFAEYQHYDGSTQDGAGFFYESGMACPVPGAGAMPSPFDMTGTAHEPGVPMASVVTDQQAYTGAGMPVNPDYSGFIGQQMPDGSIVATQLYDENGNPINPSSY